ncbi:membrane protein [Streptomyces albus]|uniref:Membrane protein n=1 Tax=Streptomyces albus (strain ATCC 21838 / DSM 41398 / FERM P-419 / JCM 4703 / NBRC 107858) TaxID=1081613 RepID=A0A0B5EVR3_STRA4|nr:membrane protein [Streptomyces albus]AOU81197.1 membrane protein [Streptomyces albus]
MARRPLPRILSNPRAQVARSRELARTAADGATDVLHPLLTISRGLRRLAAAARTKWAETPKDRRGPLLFFVAALVLTVALVPYGPLLALITLMAAAGWAGRAPGAAAEPEVPQEDRTERLQSLYDALVPHFSVPEDPDPLYAHGGEWSRALGDHDFDENGRVSSLTLRYPAYFPDGDPEARARIEQLLHAKAGRGREYHFDWAQEANILTLTVLAPLPTDIAAQRFVTAAEEVVLGFTDPGAVRRTLPVSRGRGTEDLPPVVWRTGARSTEPHLLAVGQPGSGTTTLLRSLALQALEHGEVLVIEGSGSGEYACLNGRPGVLAVECGLTGALAGLEWAARETERRLLAANRARQAGQAPPPDCTRPLWILLDRPSVLGHVAAADGRGDPQSLLQVPLRHGRAAQVTVVVAEQFDGFDALGEPVLQHTRARVVLGRTNEAQTQLVLGLPPHTTPTEEMPPGRGYARLGTGPVHRLQVPATPDPYDEATSETHRAAVRALLPEAAPEAEAAAVPKAPADTEAAEDEAAEPLPEAPPGGTATAEPAQPEEPTQTARTEETAQTADRAGAAVRDKAPVSQAPRAPVPVLDGPGS